MNLPSIASESEAENLAISRAKSNPKDFEVLYKKYFEPVFRFVNHRLMEKQTALDITQQVFVKAMLKINQYTDRGLSFQSWLFRIALNDLNKFYKQQKNEVCLHLNSEGIEDFLSETACDLGAELDQKLSKALGTLSEENLWLIDMRFFEKRSFAEMGEILGITENNAKVKLYRAVDKLKPLMKNL